MMKHDEFRKKMHEVMRIENDLCKCIHREVKEICGKDKMIVFHRPINVDFGDYKQFDAVAVCGNILMARCANGWCDKPVQPYYAHVWNFGWMNTLLENGEYHFSENPIKDKKLVLAI